MSSGVYCVLNTINGKRYIGSSIDIEGRWRNHLKTLRRGTHHSRHLQSAFDKYGEEAFTLEVLEECEKGQCIPREQSYLDILLPEYNLDPTAGSRLGSKASSETRHKQSEALLERGVSGEQNGFYGKHHSEAARRAIGSAFQGKTLSVEHRRKIGDAHKGRRFTEEQRRRLSEAHKGQTLSIETRRKIAESLKGRPSPMRGRHHSEETKKKLREALSRERHPRYGRIVSEETRRRISESLKRYHATVQATS